MQVGEDTKICEFDQEAEDENFRSNAMAGEEGVEVVIRTIGGDSRELTGLILTDPFSRLVEKVAATFRILSGSVCLSLGAKICSEEDMQRPCAELGICSGSELMLVRRRVTVVEPGLRIQIRDAGTIPVNGIYIALVDRTGYCNRGQYVFIKEDRSTAHCISWYESTGLKLYDEYGRRGEQHVWPSGWYIENSWGHDGIYFLPSHDCTQLPLDSWQAYHAERWSQPGDLPTPSIVLLGSVVSSPRFGRLSITDARILACVSQHHHVLIRGSC